MNATLGFYMQIMRYSIEIIASAFFKAQIDPVSYTWTDIVDVARLLHSRNYRRRLSGLRYFVTKHRHEIREAVINLQAENEIPVSFCSLFVR